MAMDITLTSSHIAQCFQVAIEIHSVVSHITDNKFRSHKAF